MKCMLPHGKGFGSMFTKGANGSTPADNASNKQDEHRGVKTALPAKGARNSYN